MFLGSLYVSKTNSKLKVKMVLRKLTADSQKPIAQKMRSATQMKLNCDSEKGVVMVIAVLMLTSLMAVTALVIDTGMVYLTRAQLQKAADAAALAGARTLRLTGNQAEAETAGTQYVAFNSSAPYQEAFQSSLTTGRFTVNLSKEVKFFFAPLIGFNRTTVKVSAVAAAWAVTKLNNIVPFGVLEQEFVYGQQYILKYGAGSGELDSGGNYGALALGGTGAKVYLVNLKFGYSGTIAVGDQLTTEPGNMAGPTDDGVSYRIGLCTDGCSYETKIAADCPRIVLVPVIDTLPDGRGYTTVKGFAAFFLEETVESDSQGKKDVVGRFLQYAVTAEASEDSPDFGVYTIKLIQ
jgi:Flp pilus assembly protein TadG